MKAEYPDAELVPALHADDGLRLRFRVSHRDSGGPYCCPWKGEPHRSNNVYVDLHLAACVAEWVCHDEDCRSLRRRQVALPWAFDGKAPEAIDDAAPDDDDVSASSVQQLQ